MAGGEFSHFRINSYILTCAVGAESFGGVALASYDENVYPVDALT